MRERVVVIGAGGQAKIIVDALLRSEAYEVVGYTDVNRPVGTLWFGLPVLGPDTEIVTIVEEHGIDAGIISVGDNFTRGGIADRVDADLPGFPWANAIHPSVQIAHGCEIGVGVLMMAGVVVNPDAVVGDHAHIDTNSSLDHDGALGRCGSISANATIGGSSKVGEFTAVSLGAHVIHDLTVGCHTVIGAGALVVNDIPDYVVAYGAPARVVRPRAAGDPYLP